MRASEAKTADNTGQASERFQGTDSNTEFRYKSGISGKLPLLFERVNEVSWKLTSGELTNVPASHGQWGGYRTTKAVAWVICVAPGEWLARCGDQVCGPVSLANAKRHALALAKGVPGDYFITNPIAHLNGLQARLSDGDGGTGNA
jgi:hypothetical protein